MEIMFGFLVMTTLVFIAFKALRVVRRLTVFEYEKGLCYKRGKFDRVLEPGVYWYWGHTTMIRKYDVRTKNISVSGQEVLTSDGIGIKLSFTAEYGFADLTKAVNEYENYYNAFYYDIQSACRVVVGNTKAEELLDKRNEISDKISEVVKAKGPQFGLSVHSFGIKDIMFPGSLKDIFAQVLKAQKQAMAELERARGQSASLRHLANAAKMMENNPALMNLRLIQAVSEGTGNTVVLKLDGESTVDPALTKKS